MKKILAGLLVALASTGANAQLIKGSQLREWVAGYERIDNGNKTGVDFTNSASAMSYITAIAESYGNMKVLCVPSGVTIGQMVSVVSKYLRDNPEKWNQDANALTFVALATAFPCTKK